MGTLDLIMPYLLLGIHILLAGLGIIFVISGIDELVIDCTYIIDKVYRWIFIRHKFPPLSEAQLLAPPEKPVAIMIPCWDESAVIRRMLNNTIKVINYTNY